MYVAVRIRPLNKKEMHVEDTRVVEPMGEASVMLANPTHKSHKMGEQDYDPGADAVREFHFDRVFWSPQRGGDPLGTQTHSQEGVFEELGSMFLDSAFQGYNSSIFAYGQVCTIYTQHHLHTTPSTHNTIYTQTIYTHNNNTQQQHNTTHNTTNGNVTAG